MRTNNLSGKLYKKLRPVVFVFSDEQDCLQYVSVVVAYSFTVFFVL